MSGYRRLGQNVTIHPTAEINVAHLEIGSGAVIGAHVLIEGTRVRIGRDAFLDRYAYIGGGSAFDPNAFLEAGDFFHMGRQSHVNIARGVTVGDEFGCGIETKVFTHGAYPSEVDGFPVSFAPVTIGSRVWLPNAWVNPGVQIGDDVVVSARSLVNRSLPSGCLAGGIPCRVLREKCYPMALAPARRESIVDAILVEAREIAVAKNITSLPASWTVGGDTFITGETAFGVGTRTLSGAATPWTELLKNQLRRHGIRFKYTAVDGHYEGWDRAGY